VLANVVKGGRFGGGDYAIMDVFAVTNCPLG